MTHVGYEADQALARAIPTIDVIVGGHTHSVLGYHPHSEGPYPTVIPHDDGSQTLVVQAGRSTRYLGRLTVSFDDAGRIVQFEGDLEELVPSLRRDEAMHESLFSRLRPFEPIRSVSWESTRRPFPTGSIPVEKATASREWQLTTRFSPGAGQEVRLQRF